MLVAFEEFQDKLVGLLTSHSKMDEMRVLPCHDVSDTLRVIRGERTGLCVFFHTNHIDKEGHAPRAKKADP
jgi:hypothetical protein